MTAQVHTLYTPVRVGAWSLRNRVVMAPMTRARSGAEGVPTPLNAEYYAQRASAGLIVAEATQIHPDGQGYVRTPGIHDAAQIAGWRAVTDAVHAAGGVIVLQLWHVGRVAHPFNQMPGARIVGPSADAAAVRIYTAQGMHPAPVPEALSADEVKGVALQYADAAARAMSAGFDGVELHAGNGYLIDQFLQAGANRRSDRYGGSVANRCRLLLEASEAVAARIGADRTGVRLSPFGTFNDVSDPDPAGLFGTAMAGLGTLGLAYLHVINLEVSGDRSVEGRGNEAAAATAVDVAAFSRAHYPGVLMVAGGYTARSAEAAIDAGAADLIGFGRPYIANPDLAYRLQHGLALAEPQRASFYTEGAAGYADYPAAA